MMGKHRLSQKNILYYVTVFMYDHIENSLSKHSCCMTLCFSVFLFKFKTLILIQINIKDAGLHLLMKAAKKCTNFLLEVTVRICKVLFCHTTDLSILTDSSVKLSANLLLQQIKKKKKKKKKKKE